MTSTEILNEQERPATQTDLTDFPVGITVDLLEALTPLPYWQDMAFSFAHRGSERAIVFRLGSGTRDVVLLVGDEGSWAAFQALIYPNLPQPAHPSVFGQLAALHPDLELKLESSPQKDTEGEDSPFPTLFAYAERNLDELLTSPQQVLNALFSEFDLVEERVKEYLERRILG